MNPKFPPPRVIAVDVDGTLFIRGHVNSKLVAWIKDRKAQGFEVIIWSSRGTKHAKRGAELAGLSGVADVVISKPGYIVDDRAWSWIRFTRVVRSFTESMETPPATKESLATESPHEVTEASIEGRAGT